MMQRGSSIMNGKQNAAPFRCCRGRTAVLELYPVENEVYDALANAAKFTMGSVSRGVPAAAPLRKAPAAGKCCGCSLMLDRTRQYCTVPAGLWLQSLLLRLFPREYMWLRNIKGRGELKIA